MSRVNRRPRAFAGVTIAAILVLSACHSVDSSEPTETVIAVSEFETVGDAQQTVAQEMAANLAAALNADSHVKARAQTEVSGDSVDYILKGSVYAEGQRAFVGLQLMDAKTTKRVWSENYDYRGIGADLMAADIRAYLRDLASTSERDRR
jgi:TolB-like protein